MIQEADENYEKDATLVEGSTYLQKALSNNLRVSDNNQFTFEEGQPHLGGDGLASYSPPTQSSPITDEQALNRQLISSFEMKHPIDLSIDPSRATNNVDFQGQLSPTSNQPFSRITGIRAANGAAATGDFSNFCDDSKILDMLMTDPGNGGADAAEAQKLFQEIDMGQIDEEERQYLIVDKDTGRVYDLRKEEQVDRLCARQTRLTSGENSLLMQR